MKTLPACPFWPLHTLITSGHWTQAGAELFSNPEKPDELHLHFYCTTQKARTLWSGVKHLIPSNTVSVSFINPWTVMFWIPKNEMRVVKNDDCNGDEFEWLPEHFDTRPSFETPEAASEYIRSQYPHLQP